MRTTHFIQPNAETRFPKHILVVDTEARIATDGNVQRQSFRLGYAIYLKWDSVSEIWIETEYPLFSLPSWYALLDELMVQKMKLVVFAHNAAYDYTTLMMDTYLSSRKFIISTHVIDSVFIVRSHNENRDLTFASTTNLYQKKLSELGKIFGDEKQECPDFENVSDERLMAYCRQDTKVLATIVKQHIAFVLSRDLGDFQLTIAGQAFGAFRHRFMREKILVHTYQDILEMELDSYRGGRSEVFQMGSHDEIYKLDINSMYPYMMLQHEYPIRILSNGKLNGENGISLNDLPPNTHVLADCDIELFEPAIAVRKDKLCFPIGRARQTLTDPEYRYLISHPDIGRIAKVHSWASYKSANIFRDYVEYFYRLRQESKNDAHKAIAKLLLNSLYGKFGQRSYETQSPVTGVDLISKVSGDMDDAGTNVIDYLDRDEIRHYRRNGSSLYLIEVSSDILGYDSCPIIASTVTGYARCYLYDIMRQAGLDNILYCDTDSVFTTKTGYDNLRPLISQTELGMLKLEEVGSCQISGIKNYTFNGVKKLKGVKKDAIQLSKNTYSQSQFVTKKQRYREGTPDGIVIVNQVEKTISENYDKGTVRPDGRVMPLVFDDWKKS